MDFDDMNIWNIDDTLLYAKSLGELKSMTEKLLHEIKNIALSLNDKQIFDLKYRFIVLKCGVNLYIYIYIYIALNM